jgi:hypothetical protein
VLAIDASHKYLPKSCTTLLEVTTNARRVSAVDHNVTNADTRCLLAKTKMILAIPKIRAQSSILNKLP